MLASHVLPLVAALAIVSAPVQAAGPATSDVDGLIGVLTSMGHSVVEEDADDGPNLVIDGGAWSISLADCTERAQCAYGWVYARRQLEHYVYAECANDWNGQEPFGTAWIDNVSQPWLVATLNLQGDASPAAVGSTLAWYEAQLTRFEDYIQTCPPIDKDAF